MTRLATSRSRWWQLFVTTGGLSRIANASKELLGSPTVVQQIDGGEGNPKSILAPALRTSTVFRTIIESRLIA
jgi:hypothetical protein